MENFNCKAKMRGLQQFDTDGTLAMFYLQDREYGTLT